MAAALCQFTPADPGFAFTELHWGNAAPPYHCRGCSSQSAAPSNAPACLPATLLKYGPATSARPNVGKWCCDLLHGVTAPLRFWPSSSSVMAEGWLGQISCREICRPRQLPSLLIAKAAFAATPTFPITRRCSSQIQEERCVDTAVDWMYFSAFFGNLPALVLSRHWILSASQFALWAFFSCTQAPAGSNIWSHLCQFLLCPRYSLLFKSICKLQDKVRIFRQSK